MLGEVEVGAGMDTLHLLEAERHAEFDVGGSIGVVGQFLVVVEAVLFVAKAEGLVPFEAAFLPGLEPFDFLAGSHEELHFHLLELAHAENELACHNLVAEGLAYLGYAEGQTHAAGLLYVEIVHENALGCLGAEIYGHGTVGSGAHFGAEHEVELTNVGPVAGTGDGTHDFLVDDYLAEFGEVVVVHCFCIALVECLTLGGYFSHAGVGLTEKRFIERLAEALAGLCDFFFNFVVHLGYLLFDEHIGAVALFRVTVVDEGIIEGIDVSGSLPDGRMHKDG